MPAFILKVTPDRDLYAEWSTIVDNAVRVGTRAEFLEHLAAVQPDLLTDSEHSPAARMARAFVYGTSALPALEDHPRFGGWDSSGLMVEQRGVLRRGDLEAYVAAMEADDPDTAYALLVPFDDERTAPKMPPNLLGARVGMTIDLGTLHLEQESPSFANPDVTRQTFTVLDDISRERRDQDRRWGEQRHEPPVWLAILTEEVGEAAKEIAEGWAGGEWDPAACRKELVQVAAVAVAAIETLDHGAAGLGREAAADCQLVSRPRYAESLGNRERPRAFAPNPGNAPICGRLLVGQGTDTWDPICQRPKGHPGGCRPCNKKGTA